MRVRVCMHVRVECACRQHILKREEIRVSIEVENVTAWIQSLTFIHDESLFKDICGMDSESELQVKVFLIHKLD